MDVLTSTLLGWYETNSAIYATATVCLVVVVGSFIGWLMDLAGKRLGVDTHSVEHHREHL